MKKGCFCFPCLTWKTGVRTECGKTMKLQFTKMHGCGNDYIYFDCFRQKIQTPDALSVRLSDRRKGIGSDGVILIEPSQKADAFMRIFNRDGSEGKMCGNGIRCVGKYLYDSGLVQKEELTIDTRSGLKKLFLHTNGKRVDWVRVEMGTAQLQPACIPVLLPGDAVVDAPVELGGATWNITCVSMGNPHCAVFCKDVDALDLPLLGPLFEHSKLFPEGVNTEFIEAVGPKELRMRVWERGSGETHACGTGACAAAVASVLKGLNKSGEEITVHLTGGDLTICVTGNGVSMTGEAVTVFQGEVEL